MQDHRERFLRAMQNESDTHPTRRNRSSAPSSPHEIEAAILEALRDAKRREETSQNKEREELEYILRMSLEFSCLAKTEFIYFMQSAVCMGMTLKGVVSNLRKSCWVSLKITSFWTT